MTKDFEFNAPQFINFAEMDDPKADSFFDVQTHEEKELSSLTPQISKKISEESINKENESQIQDSVTIVKNPDVSGSKKNLPVLRKALHEIVNQQIQIDTGSLPLEDQNKNAEKDIIQHFEKLQVSDAQQKNSKAPVKATEVFNNLTNKKSGRKSHQMITRLDIMNLKQENLNAARNLKMNDSLLCVDYNNIVISDEEISSTTSSVNKSKTIKRIGSPLHSSKKFISLAEQVEHFHKDTPERFRSKPKKHNMSPAWSAKSNCLPKTPKLTARFRQRKIDYPNEKEREEMELEEIRKHQIKAHPLNEKILLGPSLNLKIPVVKKPATIPQPFSLTEVKKKDPPQEPVYHFKAQPVPTVILERPVGIPPRKITSPTVATTPLIRVPLRFRVEVKTPDKISSTESLKTSAPRNTKIEPFSFDARMKETLQKKEEFVKKVVEEEKKSFNSFKANPMPAFKSKNDSSIKQEKTHKIEVQPFNLTQPKVNKSFSESQEIKALKVTPFKARPATVVHQKPFIPIIQRHELIFPVNFQLNTEKRAMERQKFDEKIKQKEEENALILKLQKEEEEREEKEKMLEERKKLEFKAKPMPRFRAFEVHGSDPKKLTLPKSPMFSLKKREIQKVNHLNDSS